MATTRKIMIKGQVTDAITNKGIRGLLIQAWDEDLLIKRSVGKAISNAAGRFTISLDVALLIRMFKSRTPVLFFKVLKQNRVVQETKGTATWHYKNPSSVAIAYTSVSVEGGDDVGPSRETYIPALARKRAQELCLIEGTLLDADGEAVSGVSVMALRKVLGGDITLAKTKSLGNGSYKVSYRKDTSENQDVFVSVQDENGFVFGRSAVVFNARQSTIININLPVQNRKRPTVFEKVEKGVRPFLKGLNAHRLNGEDVVYLSEKIGIKSSMIAAFIEATRLSHETGLETAPFFGLIRQNQSSTLPGLTCRSTETLLSAIKRAEDREVIPKR
ncbi:MAG: hypothetical protein ACI9BD_001537, partial [Candidatus Marinamargulisbacteria bacterium]